jgi:23S rRNA (cytidine1920-2'-O)/16S rRNA (cytidine1409-2'-O)-methyltransferase
MARRLIQAGEVTVNGQLMDKPGSRVPKDVELAVKTPPPYVSRGGLKLEAALDAFYIQITGRVVADIGASTGGFTDCLLQRGAAQVYAIDVGYGQLDWRLRNDRRVVVMERTNARYLESLPEPIDLVTADVSFISLELVLRPAMNWFKPGGVVEMVVLVKPQFQAGRRQVGKGGVVKDPAVHLQVLEDMLQWAQQQSLVPHGLIQSPIKGPAGNIEFLLWLRTDGEGVPPAELIDSLDLIISDTE